MSRFNEENTSHFVNIEDAGRTLNIHYNDIGDGNNVVVMLHGSGPGATGWANFNRNIDPLIDAGFRVLLINCPGWGKTDTVVCAESRSELNGRVVKAVIDQLGINKISLLGNSMGGHSAVAFALANPDNVDKLVLMGGGTGGVSSFVPMPTEGIKLIGALYREPTLENLKRMMNVFVYDASDLTEDLMQARLTNLLARPDHLENFVKSLQAHPKQFPDQSARLDEINAETLIVWGRNDRFVPVDTGYRLNAGILNSQLHVFNKCGHWAQWEHAEKFNRLVLDFLTH
ncbi:MULTISPECIES: alpha/beta fold hydrolase [unclassified Pseudomonas]|jgi:2-hydroxy-6-oxonona-2,4-dienedioate hydrolase|uniref:alpha/beta fold hydrolase n=1 Tax=unclassified Pseudomonas TaxID=196821 RepID=UPI00111005AA|nr:MULTISPECIES: alpha/beta fold hydrolase [unclassified Pseudomonas]MBU4626327.1 alpha/beta fold hydrolase [Pseudomonas sp. BF61]QCY14738.1 alpha/beta fold hydrolase [Pseudomonas sp. MPC6]VVO90911.1 2-hydroxy-6-oxononadienedioate/2-hydroxy-6-oxononatrienedioate hydrolase [Pseudomonas fluorescens]